MPERTKATKHTVPTLIRVKSGTADDTIYANGATVPSDDDCGLFSGRVPFRSGKGHASEVELHIVAVNGDRTVLARGTCTFDLRIVHVVERQFSAGPGVTAGDFASAVEPLTGQSLQSAIRVPWGGGKMFVGFENIANPPAGTTDIEVWAMPVAG